MRKTCRIISQKDVLVVCSNQIRQNLDAGPYGSKYKSPGGEAIGFYSSLRLRCKSAEKIKVKKKIKGKDHERIIGVKTEIEVFKSSVWKPCLLYTSYYSKDATDKPLGIPIELADAIIRILDYCAKEGIDIEEALRIKHEYNKLRSYWHGKRF